MVKIPSNIGWYLYSCVPSFYLNTSYPLFHFSKRMNYLLFSSSLFLPWEVLLKFFM